MPCWGAWSRLPRSKRPIQVSLQGSLSRSVSRGTGQDGEDGARGREGAVASDPTWTHLAEALVLPRCYPGQVSPVEFYSPFLIPSPEDGKKKGESSSGSGSGGGSGSSGTGGSSRPPAPPEDTASEAGTPQGEAQARDDGDEEGLLTHSEEELVRACLGGRLGLVCVPLVAGGLQGVGGASLDCLAAL